MKELELSELAADSQNKEIFHRLWAKIKDSRRGSDGQASVFGLGAGSSLPGFLDFGLHTLHWKCDFPKQNEL